MEKVNIGINEPQREEIAEKLANFLSDAYVLYLKTHNYHWNVRGPMFHTLHNMFEEQYREQWDALDDIAERIRTLGEDAPGTYKEFVKRAQIQEDESIPKAEQMIDNLVKDHEAIVRSAKELGKLADAAGDEPTVDLLNDRMGAHEKTAWMLRSLIS